MGQETAPFINSLNAAWPLSSDKIRFGAVHLRTIKSALLATFPNVTGAITLTHTQVNNAAIKTAQNVFSGNVANTAAAIAIESNAPGIALKELDAAADNRVWRQLAAAGVLRSDVMDDANNATIFRRVFRTGGTIDEVRYAATLFKIEGKLETSGAIEVGQPLEEPVLRPAVVLSGGAVVVRGISRPPCRRRLR